MAFGLRPTPSSLPIDERAALVLRLAESLDEEHDADANDVWAAEVAARIETVRAGTAETITTAEALAQARARLLAPPPKPAPAPVPSQPRSTARRLRTIPSQRHERSRT